MRKYNFCLLFLFINCSSFPQVDTRNNNVIYRDYENYNFIIWLVKDIKFANELWHNHDSSLILSTVTTEINVSDGITPFIIFSSRKSGNIHIDMQLRLIKPDSTYIESNDGSFFNVFNENVINNMYYKIQRNPVTYSGEDSMLGEYMFKITLKINDEIIDEIYIGFELK